MGSQETPLTALLMQESDPGLHEYHHALAGIEKYYSRLHIAMGDGRVHDQLVLNPTQFLSRLRRSFEILKTKQLARPVSEGIFKGVVIPLIRPKETLLSSTQLVQLVGSALPMLLKHPSSYLRQVAEVLLSTEGLFHHLVADEKYTAVMKTWLLSKRNYLDLPLVTRIAEKLFAMSNDCSADHGTSTTFEKWNMVNHLMGDVQALIHTYNENTQRPRQTENLPPLEKMKMLQLDDKKSNRTQHDRKGFTIPAESLDKLRLLDCPILETGRGLTHALEYLRNRVIPSCMQVALESFPCRFCLDALTGNSEAFLNPLDPHTSEPAEVESKYDIFGKRVGLWKVLLSDNAMKSAKKLARAG